MHRVAQSTIKYELLCVYQVILCVVVINTYSSNEYVQNFHSYHALCSHLQRAGNGSDVIFLLVALKCCHAGTIGAIPYVNQCCTLYPPPPHTISTSLTDHVLRELFNYSYYSTIFFWVVAMVTIPVVQSCIARLLFSLCHCVRQKRVYSPVRIPDSS